MMRLGDMAAWVQITLSDAPDGRTYISVVNRSNGRDEDRYDPITELCANDVAVDREEDAVIVTASVGNVATWLYCDEVRDCRGVKPCDLCDAPWICSGAWQKVLDEQPDEIDAWMEELKAEHPEWKEGEE